VNNRLLIAMFIHNFALGCTSSYGLTMLKRLLDALRSERTLPLAIRLPLVDGLFYPFASLITGALAGLWIATTVVLSVHDLIVDSLAVLVVVTALARIVVGFRYIKGTPAGAKDVAFWEWAYGLGAALFSLSLGLLAMFAMLRVQNSPLHLMLTTTTAGYAASITGRNAGRPWIAMSQLYLAAGPMCLGLVLSHITFYQILGCALFLFLFGMTDITLSVRKTIVGILETRFEIADLAKSFENQANLFDAALNNMSHGLCMFDGDGRLLVWNHKLAGILDCEDEVFVTGIGIKELLSRVEARAPGKRGAMLMEALRQSFESGTNRQMMVRLGADKVIAVSRQRMPNRNMVIVFEDVTEQTKANLRIEQLAWTDELTGLMNRASFREVLGKTIAVTKPGAVSALHLIDLDNFKGVNDSLGHPIGDALLVEVARRIRAVAEKDGQVARLGGDEFVIVQRVLGDAEEIQRLASDVIVSLCEPFEIEGNRINIGASIGIACLPQHGDSVDVLLKRADMALYKAKSEGRQCYRMFEDGLDLRVQQRRALELDIRAALELGQFHLAFQPIIGAPDGEVASFETLIRWEHPTRGYVSPAVFIPVAEDMGVIIEIGRWVLEEACRQAASWPTNAAVAVNFSAIQFQDKTFPMFLAATLDKFGLPSSRVELEITETALLENSDATVDMLQQFRALGIGISLDDFGTGYSSLSQLRTFPFSKIKIDGSFVRDIERDASAIAVIRSVVTLGKILGMAVVAECVESEDQLRFLSSAGCDQIQGYLLGRPQRAEAVREWLACYDANRLGTLLAA
jgi:diguanylate cyclase (GGDEF)-like protein